MADSEQDVPAKRFRLQRRRLGKVMFLHEKGTYGFIKAEDFRDDVFFHLRDWQGEVTKDGVTRHQEPEVDTWVEFELDDEHFAQEKKLRAKIVRPTDRPAGRKLSGRDATFQIVTHHPNARKKRPTWRE